MGIQKQFMQDVSSTWFPVDAVHLFDFFWHARFNFSSSSHALALIGIRRPGQCFYIFTSVLDEWL